MRTTSGSIVFRYFDKALVAILALLALGYIVMAIVDRPEPVYPRGEVDRLINKIEATQLASRHTPTPLTEDYVGLTIGSLRPDARGFRPREGVMIKLKDKPVRPLGRKDLALNPEGVPTPKDFSGLDEYANHEVRVLDEKIVKVEWSDAAPSTLTLTPITAGKTTVELVKGGQKRAWFEVVVIQEIRQDPTIYPPRAVSTKYSRGQKHVVVGWTASATHDATVAEYVILKGESAATLKPYVRVLVPKKPAPKEPAPAPKEPVPAPKKPAPAPKERVPAPKEPAPAPKKPVPAPKEGVPAPKEGAPAPKDERAATPALKLIALRVDSGKPAGGARAVGSEFEFQDSEVEGGVRYWYAVEARGRTDKEGTAIASKPSVKRAVTVPEVFVIRFRRLSDDHVNIIVSLEYVPPEGGARKMLEYTFTNVMRGEPVGAIVGEVPVRGQAERVRNVDFRTGYHVLDILNDERVSAPVPGDPTREKEEKRQKLLLINARGRIKMLWPSVPGQKKPK